MLNLIAPTILLLWASSTVIASPLATRTIKCPPGLHCGPGPVCTINTCGLCPDFPGCATKLKERAPAPEPSLPCPPGLQCGHGPVCTIKTCGLCPDFPGCAAKLRAREAEAAAQPEPIIHPCPQICDANGHCVCANGFPPT